MSIQMILAPFLLTVGIHEEPTPQEVTSGQQTVDIVTELKLPFSCDGKVVLGWAVKGLGGWQNLSFLSPSQTFVIRELPELQGHVEITSAEDALAYVRLRTSPATFRAFLDVPILMRGTIAEVYPKELLTKMNFFGCESVREEVTSKEYEGYAGVISKSTFDSFGLALPEARAAENGFEIKRWIVYFESYDRTSPKVVLIRELVSSDGGYEVAEQSALDPALVKRIHWILRVHGSAPRT